MNYLMVTVLLLMGTSLSCGHSSTQFQPICPSDYVATLNSSIPLPDDANCIELSGDGQVLAVGLVDSTVLLADGSRGTTLARLGKPQADRFGALGTLGTYAVAFDHKGLLLASTGWDHRISLWEIRSGRLIHTINLPEDMTLHALCFSSRGDAIVGGGVCITDKNSRTVIGIWTTEGKLKSRWEMPLANDESKGVSRLVWREKNDEVLIGTTDGCVYVWPTLELAPRLTFSALGGVNDLVISPTGRQAAWADECGAVMAVCFDEKVPKPRALRGGLTPPCRLMFLGGVSEPLIGWGGQSSAWVNWWGSVDSDWTPYRMNRGQWLHSDFRIRAVAESMKSEIFGWAVDHRGKRDHIRKVDFERFRADR